MVDLNVLNMSDSVFLKGLNMSEFVFPGEFVSMEISLSLSHHFRDCMLFGVDYLSLVLLFLVKEE